MHVIMSRIPATHAQKSARITGVRYLGCSFGSVRGILPPFDGYRNVNRQKFNKDQFIPSRMCYLCYAFTLSEIQVEAEWKGEGTYSHCPQQKNNKKCQNIVLAISTSKNLLGIDFTP